MSLAHEIAQALYPGGRIEGTGNGGWVTCCPVHGDKNPSMSIWDDGNGGVNVDCKTGCDWKDIKDTLVSMGLLPVWKPDTGYQGGHTQSKTHKPPKKAAAKPEKEKPSFIWEQATRRQEDIEFIKKYLANRSIKLDELPLPLAKGEYIDKKNDGELVHMIVAAASHPGDKNVFAVQRLFIDPADHTKDGSKMHGKCADAGRMIWFDRHGDKSIMIVGEGIETVLSVMQVTGMNGAAALSTAGLKNAIYPEETHTVYFLVDSDPVREKEAASMPGQKAALIAARKFAESRSDRRSFLVTPDSTCFSEKPNRLDFNDLLKKNPTGLSIKNRFDQAIALEDLDWEPPSKDESGSDEDDEHDDGGRYPPAALKALHQLNRNHALVILSGDARIVMEDKEEHEDRPRHYVQFLKQYAFHAYYSNEHIMVRSGKDGALERKELTKEWWLWEGRKSYKGIVFDPSAQPNPDKYNLFRGFPLESKKGDWSLMRQHIEQIICCGNKEHFDYLMAWMARIVQDPGGPRPGVAVVLKSGKGVGKGAFVNYFGEIFGEAFLSLADTSSFTGRFNMHLSKALLVFLDEAVWGGDKKAEGKLKQLITEPYILFEPKGIDSVSLDNHMNLIIASNEEWVVPATGDERRFFVLEPDESKAKDTKYFDAIFKERRNGGPEAMMYDLLNYDISGVDLRKAPVTNGLVDQVQQSLPSVLVFWLEIINREYLLSDRETGAPVKSDIRDIPGNDDIWPVVAYKYEIYKEYENWCRARSERYPANERQFWKDTWTIWPGGNPGRLRKGTAYILKLPTIEELQAAFTCETKITFNEEVATMFEPDIPFKGQF